MSFERTAITAAEYRRVLGHLPTGVTVVTAFEADGSPVGMAANSLTSVSLDPPLILVCPAKSSTTWPQIRQARRFCVNVMAHDHAELSVRFAQRGIDRFADVEWHRRTHGPGLDGAVAWLGCEAEDEWEAGDHMLVTALVCELEAVSEVPPLVFFRGGYGSFAET